VKRALLAVIMVLAGSPYRAAAGLARPHRWRAPVAVYLSCEGAIPRAIPEENRMGARFQMLMSRDPLAIILGWGPSPRSVFSSTSRCVAISRTRRNDGGRGAGTRPPVPPYLERLCPPNAILPRGPSRSRAVHPFWSGPSRRAGGRSEVAPAGLVAQVSSAQALPALERPAEVAETGHEGDERIEDDSQRR
jgi:hypothetical protein